ncbi:MULTISPECIES: hypothetical protein [Mesorhizobium]|nr:MULTISPECIES: hypothetical protein [Mesorhizobium]
METYSFWQDFFATYRSSPDAIKALWLIVPPTFAVALARVVLSAFHDAPESNITVEFESRDQPVQSRENEEVLIFAGGRLLDRFEIPQKSDSRITRPRML